MASGHGCLITNRAETGVLYGRAGSGVVSISLAQMSIFCPASTKTQSPAGEPRESSSDVIKATGGMLLVLFFHEGRICLNAAEQRCEILRSEEGHS